MPDDYTTRNEILTAFYKYTKAWLLAALSASPLELSGLLQEYLDDGHNLDLTRDSGMGKSVALEIARMMPISAREGNSAEGEGNRLFANKFCTGGFPNYGGWKADTTSLFSSTFGTRHTYGAEAKTLIGLGN